MLPDDLSKDPIQKLEFRIESSIEPLLDPFIFQNNLIVRLYSEKCCVIIDWNVESHSYPNYEVLSEWIVAIAVIGFNISDKLKFALIGILNVVGILVFVRLLDMEWCNNTCWEFVSNERIEESPEGN